MGIGEQAVELLQRAYKVEVLACQRMGITGPLCLTFSEWVDMAMTALPDDCIGNYRPILKRARRYVRTMGYQRYQALLGN